MPNTDQRIDFHAPEYDSDGGFTDVAYTFLGNTTTGWRILRDGQQSLTLGPGYVPVRSRYCGVCSTDLARHFLPYPLPQIIGHEVVGTLNGQDVTVEINASHQARHDPHAASCPFCSGGIDTQCPERITLGIDRLPGGFAPYFLAPVDAIVPLPTGLSPETAVLTEPFAAALHAADTLPDGDALSVAVLGPRRLGMLLVAALAAIRRRENRTFTIAALARHDNLLELALRLGADEGVRVDRAASVAYDVVFDTTGSIEGFELALRSARRILHLKSTNGQEAMGFARLTDMVVHEIALVPAAAPYLDFRWPRESEPRSNPNVLVSPNVPASLVTELSAATPHRRFHRLTTAEALAQVDAGALEGSPLPRFDLGIAAEPADVDAMLRPEAGREVSLIRPRGAILLARTGAASPLWTAIAERGLQLHSSRCGDFRRATALLAENPAIAKILEQELITQRFPLDEIGTAFAVAADSTKSIKVVVDTSEPGQMQSRKSRGRA